MRLLVHLYDHRPGSCSGSPPYDEFRAQKRVELKLNYVADQEAVLAILSGMSNQEFKERSRNCPDQILEAVHKMYKDFGLKFKPDEVAFHQFRVMQIL